MQPQAELIPADVATAWLRDAVGSYDDAGVLLHSYVRFCLSADSVAGSVTEADAWAIYRRVAGSTGLSRRDFGSAWARVSASAAAADAGVRSGRVRVARRTLAHLLATPFSPLPPRRQARARFALASIGCKMLADASQGNTASIISAGWLAVRLGVSHRTAVTLLNDLQKVGAIRKVRRLPRGGRPWTYRLARLKPTDSHRTLATFMGPLVDALADADTSKLTADEAALVKLILSAGRPVWGYAGLPASAFAVELSRAATAAVPNADEAGLDFRSEALGGPRSGRRAPEFARLSTAEVVAKLDEMTNQYQVVSAQAEAREELKTKAATAKATGEELEARREVRRKARAWLRRRVYDTEIGGTPQAMLDESKVEVKRWAASVRRAVVNAEPDQPFVSGLRYVLAADIEKAGWSTEQAEKLVTAIVRMSEDKDAA